MPIRLYPRYPSTKGPVQTDTKALAVVGWKMLNGVGSGVQIAATTPDNVRECNVLWEGYDPLDFANLQNSAVMLFSTCKCIAVSMETICNGWASMAPTMLEELCKRIQQCCAYASATTEQNKCCGLLKNFYQFQTSSNNAQKHATRYANGCSM